MIRPCNDTNFDMIFAIINEAAEAYRGIIPEDRWHEPYMPKDTLCREIENGVQFWGWEEDGQLVGVMGIQDVQDVTLIRHAYVRTAKRGEGIGGKLLCELRKLASRPVLIGTWAAATWAIKFYEKHGFRLVTPEEKNRLLKKYWSIPERQVETSVVLGDERWFSYRQPLVRHRDSTQPIDCPFGHVQRIVTGGQGGIANVHVVKITKGTPHRHDGYDEVYYVLAGTGTITLGQETQPLRPGSVAVIPAGVMHSLEASAGDELEFVIFGTPPMAIDDERAKPRKG
jgi:mannose-6-phosphate isomerase-like protein (cupin superfamily)